MLAVIKVAEAIGHLHGTLVFKLQVPELKLIGINQRITELIGIDVRAVIPVIVGDRDDLVSIRKFRQRLCRRIRLPVLIHGPRSGQVSVRMVIVKHSDQFSTRSVQQARDAARDDVVFAVVFRVFMIIRNRDVAETQPDLVGRSHQPAFIVVAENVVQAVIDEALTVIVEHIEIQAIDHLPIAFGQGHAVCAVLPLLPHQLGLIKMVFPDVLSHFLIFKSPAGQEAEAAASEG